MEMNIVKPQHYAEPARPQTLAEIAASVKPPLTLRLAESAFATALAERDAARAEMLTEMARPDGSMASGPSRDSARVRDLDMRIRGPLPKGGQTLDEQLAIARLERRAAREKHAATISAALCPHRVAAGKRLAAALDEIEQAQAILVQADELVLAAGGATDLGPLYARDVETLRALAQRAQRG